MHYVLRRKLRAQVCGVRLSTCIIAGINLMRAEKWSAFSPILPTKGLPACAGTRLELRNKLEFFPGRVEKQRGVITRDTHAFTKALWIKDLATRKNLFRGFNHFSRNKPSAV